MIKQNTSTLKKLIGITILLITLFTTINAYNSIVTLNPSAIKYGVSPPTTASNYIAGDSTYTNNVFIANDSACANNVGGTTSAYVINIANDQLSEDVSLTSGNKYYFCIKLRERVSTHVIYLSGNNVASAGAIDCSTSAGATYFFELDDADQCATASSNYYYKYYIGTSGAQDIATFSWWFYA